MLLESSSASFFSFSRQRLLNGQTNSYSVSHGVTPEVCVSVWFFLLSICITLQFVPRPAAFPAPAVPDGRTDLLLVHLGGVHDDDRHAGTLLRASRAGLDPAATPRAALPGCQQRRGGPQWNRHYLLTNKDWRVLLRLRWLACSFIASIHEPSDWEYEIWRIIKTDHSPTLWMWTFSAVKWLYQLSEIRTE